MIINFSVQNFSSIKEKQTLSFEADKSTHLENAYVVNVGGHRILKLALIYGANASGKTNLLNALDFLRDLVLKPKSKKTDKLDFKPFLFDPNTPTQNSILEIEFFQNNVKYFYEVEFTEKAVVREELYFYNPNKANVYRRTTDLPNELTQISLGSKITKDKTLKKNLEANTLWNNTVLGGFLKTNMDFKELREVTNWFKNYLNPLIKTKTDLDVFVTDKIDKNEIAKKDIVAILKQADLNISDIIIEEKEVPDDFWKNMPTELKDKFNASFINIAFEHTVNNIKYSLTLPLESQGTQRYYGFAGVLAMLIKNPSAFFIDELEASLHPDLYLHFLLSFLQNAQNSQLIATTHNREILDNKDIFRNDAIWFADKQNNCATELYSLADFDTSVVRDTTNIFNAYKSGKLSATPNLGDTFIDLNPGENQKILPIKHTPPLPL